SAAEPRVPTASPVGPQSFAKSAMELPRVTGIVIKYRQGMGVTKTLSNQHAGQVAAGLGFARAAEAAARRGITLLFDRSLATGGHLLRQSRPLSPTQLRQLLNEIAQDPAVDYAEADTIRRGTLVPNDGYFPWQWHLQDVLGGIQLPAAWDLADGRGVRVAVIDSGSTYHADLSPNLIGGYDFISDPWMANDGNGRDSDPSDTGDAVSAEDSFTQCGNDRVEYASTWHGTHVAGTVAALTHNGMGVSGVAFGAKVVPVRVLGRCGGHTSDVAEAVIWAAGGNVAGVPANPYPARVINLSLSGREACSATEQASIDAARALGALVVVAAGNEDEDTRLFSPANCRGVVTVAASRETGGKAEYSNFGANVGLAAPGSSILSTFNFGYWGPGASDYRYLSGTSMAAPQVSGVAALVLQLNPTFTPEQVTARLKLGSTRFPVSCPGCGAGILNAHGALVPPRFEPGTVFRFLNMRTGAHLLSADAAERDRVLGSMPAFQYERAAFRGQASGGGGSLPVYRFLNLSNGAHFFTISEAEANAVRTRPNFVFEGVAWWARSPASPGIGTIPVHRFRNRVTGAHFYAYSQGETDHLLRFQSVTNVYEGVAFYVWPL
ncbi:MAG: S8 family peptidase, partial [Hydrogenophaga sp.]|nr:S8 family peptidase [Hydrogenophaga sp.]